MAKIIHRRTFIAAGIAGGVLAAPRHGWAKGSYPTNKIRVRTKNREDTSIAFGGRLQASFHLPSMCASGEQCGGWRAQSRCALHT